MNRIFNYFPPPRGPAPHTDNAPRRLHINLPFARQCLGGRGLTPTNPDNGPQGGSRGVQTKAPDISLVDHCLLTAGQEDRGSRTPDRTRESRQPAHLGPWHPPLTVHASLTQAPGPRAPANPGPAKAEGLHERSSLPSSGEGQRKQVTPAPAPSSWSASLYTPMPASHTRVQMRTDARV